MDCLEERRRKCDRYRLRISTRFQLLICRDKEAITMITTKKQNKISSLGGQNISFTKIKGMKWKSKPGSGMLKNQQGNISSDQGKLREDRKMY